jgi:hypothetical protein
LKGLAGGGRAEELAPQVRQLIVWRRRHGKLTHDPPRRRRFDRN